MLADTSLVRSELMVAEEAYPLASSSSSDLWKRFFSGVRDTAPVDEEGCP